MTDNPRSEFLANQALCISVAQPAQAAWLQPSRCKRPPLKLALKPCLFARVLSLLGLL